MTGSQSSLSPNRRAVFDGPNSWISSTPWFWSLLLLVSAWKCFAAAQLGLIFDECYYWEWSLHLQWCYFDHPPLTAWLIALGHALLGHSAIAVRFWALVSGVLLAIGGRLLAREMFGVAAGNRAGIFLLLAPVFAGNSLLMTPDTFLITGWSWALLFAWKGSRQKTNMLWWVATGAATGVGMLSKYSMVLIYVALCVFCLLCPGKRVRIFLGISLAAIISLLLFSPVIVWNSRNDWISFQHQLHHGFHNENDSVINFQNLGSYLLFLIVLVSPLLGLFCFFSASRFSDERFRFLAVFYWSVVLFFAFSAAKAHVEANWPMPAFVSGLILVAADWNSYGRIWQKTALLFLLIADLIAVLGVSYILLPKDSPYAVQNLVFNTSFIKGFPGSQELAATTQQALNDLQERVGEFLAPQQVADAVAKSFAQSGGDFLCLSSYQLAGVMAFYAPNLEPKIWLPYLGRFRFPWINDSVWAGKNALAAEWPHNGPDYHVLFTEFSSPEALQLRGIKRPVLISFGKVYDSTKVNYRTGN